MNQPIRKCALLAILVCTNLAHSEDPRRTKSPPKVLPGETDTNFDNYKPLADQVAKADKVVLYEGLPHQRYEKKLLEEELRTKETVQHHGFPFYAEPLQLKEGDEQGLTRLFTDASSFKPFGGYKKCGGFHPDYCVEWQVGKETYRSVICLGCHQVKLFGSSMELYCDMARESHVKFEEVFRPYHKHRPPHSSSTVDDLLGALPYRDVKRVVLYEGLPHQSLEKKLLDEELKTKKTVQHHGYPFYAEPLELKDRDARELTRLVADGKSFKPFSGYKNANFHPDYCIEWHVGNAVYRCLVCLSCHEVQGFGPERDAYCDIAQESYEKFKEVLQPYRKHRPPPSNK